MKKKYDLWPFNFGAVKLQNFEDSKVIIIPVPYEGTVSYGSGTGSGPYAIINASRYLDEMHDPGENNQMVDFKGTDVFTLDEVEVNRNSAKEALDSVQQVVAEEVVKHDKIPLVLGGEHSITLGAVKAVKRKYKDVSVLHFDAHTDCLNTLEGTRYSHACVMRRIRDLKIKVVSIGIRNVNLEAEEYFKKNRVKNVFNAPDVPPIDTIVKGLSKNVYLTFDLDCLDPSIMPSVGTPEPGGLGWYEVLNTIEKVSQKVNIVGADVMELMPIDGLEAPNFLAAKLSYFIIKNILHSNNKK